MVDEVLRRQALRMQERLRQADGAGLAATQVGVLRRLFVFRVAPEDPIQTLVNPRVLAASSERSLFVEGCLSFNSVAVAVERPARVRIEGQDLEGHQRILEFEGFGSSLVQHEIDHLDGILTLDRANPAERRRAIAELIEQARAASLAA